MSSQPLSNRHTPRPGFLLFFYLLYLFLEQCLICIIAYLGSMSRAIWWLKCQMQKQGTRKKKIIFWGGE